MSGPIFGLIPVKKGEVVSHEVSQPKRDKLIKVVKLSDDNKLESIRDKETFAKIETDKNGKVIDNNFGQNYNTEKLDQLF